MHNTHSKFANREILIVATIIATIAVYATSSWRKTIEAERQNKVTNLTRDIGNAKEYLYSLRNEDLGTNASRPTIDDDDRWLIIAEYLQITPADARTNRFELLRAFSDYNTFTIGGRGENVYIGP